MLSGELYRLVGEEIARDQARAETSSSGTT